MQIVVRERLQKVSRFDFMYEGKTGILMSTLDGSFEYKIGLLKLVLCLLWIAS